MVMQGCFLIKRSISVPPDACQKIVVVKGWALRITKRAVQQKVVVALPRRVTVIMHRMEAKKRFFLDYKRLTRCCVSSSYIKNHIIVEKYPSQNDASSQFIDIASPDRIWRSRDTKRAEYF